MIKAVRFALSIAIIFQKKRKDVKSNKPKGFSKDVKESVRRGQNGYCYFCTERIRDFHHMLHNTATNRSLFPLFINSIFNCVGLCRACHSLRQNENGAKVTEDMAREYEEALRLAKLEMEVLTLREVLSGQKSKKRQGYSGTTTEMLKVRKEV